MAVQVLQQESVRIFHGDFLKIQPRVNAQKTDDPVHQRGRIAVLLDEPIIGCQMDLEQVPPDRLQQPEIRACKVPADLFHQIGEQVVLVRKVLIKAATGNAGVLHDITDGCIGIADTGELRPGRVHEPGLLFLRQTQECFGGHLTAPLLVRNDNLS